VPFCFKQEVFFALNQILREGIVIERVAVLTAILENPKAVQEEFNRIIAESQSLIIGRMGLPLADKGISIVCITLWGSMNDINALSGRLGKLKEVHSKLTISKKEFLKGE
jgi:putative iron-only hydrogenase system regulator